jgi:hypothetical protein
MGTKDDDDSFPLKGKTIYIGLASIPRYNTTTIPILIKTRFHPYKYIMKKEKKKKTTNKIYSSDYEKERKQNKTYFLTSPHSLVDPQSMLLMVVLEYFVCSIFQAPSSHHMQPI